MKQKDREKELLNLSELIGQSHRRLYDEIAILEKLMWLLIYNAGENYSDELRRQIKESTNRENL